MFFRHQIPALPLSNFVESFWLYEDCAPPLGLERILPTGSLSLVINLREDSIRNYDRRDPSRFESLGGSLMVGAHSEYMVIDTACQAAVMGISFKPGGAFPFLKMPASELRDLHVPLDTLWQADGANLRTHLLEAATPDAKFRVLEQCLLAQAGPRLERNPVVEYALGEMQGATQMRTILDVTRMTGLSPKRFLAIFREQVGLTPKLYCRIRRFQAVLQLIRTGKRVEWTDVALSCGYFDQAHFVHDFRAFSGITPTAYAAHTGPYANHVPLAD